MMKTLLAVVALILMFVSEKCQAANYTLFTLSDYPLGSACLDGSPYAYYYRPGNESLKWVIHHEGGGWCYNLEDCYERSSTVLGTSKLWAQSSYSWGGIMYDNQAQNPDYYDWNAVILLYCDGTSFSSYREEPVQYSNTNVYFRGKNNLEAASQDLLINKGLIKATDVIITGCSAGGLSTYLHLDYWRSIIPASATVKGLADAGWFLDTTAFGGGSIYTPEMQTGFDLWNSTDGVNSDCIAAHTATNDTWKCIFAEYTYPHIKTPIFMSNSKYDSWQIPNVYGLPCYANISKCNSTEFSDFLNYGNTFLSTVAPLLQSTKDGIFVDSCYYHCQTLGISWISIISQTADGAKVSQNSAFTDWYYGKAETKAIDTCNYPCNPTC